MIKGSKNDKEEREGIREERRNKVSVCIKR